MQIHTYVHTYIYNFFNLVNIWRINARHKHSSYLFILLAINTLILFYIYKYIHWRIFAFDINHNHYVCWLVVVGTIEICCDINFNYLLNLDDFFEFYVFFVHSQPTFDYIHPSIRYEWYSFTFIHS